MENNTLNHHGTKGMRWGIRRFQRKDGSLTPEGKKRYSKDDDQPEESYEEKKARAIKSGSATEVLKYKDDLTPAERSAIETRLRWENNMKSLSESELVPKGKTRSEEFVEKMDTFTKVGTSAAKGYNFVASIYNAFNTDHMLPKVDINALNSGNRNELKAHKKEKQKAEEAKKKREEQEAQRETKQKERAEKRAKAEQEDKTEEAKTEKAETVTGTVEGEGTSRGSQTSSKQSTKSADYYDPIDVEGTWVNESRSSGQSYVSGLLGSSSNNKSVASLPGPTTQIGQTYVSGLLEDKSK